MAFCSCIATIPVASLPNADAVQAALKGCPLSIVSEAVCASDTVDACRIRLPALAWGEKSGTVTNSERRISRQPSFLPVPGDARPDWWILSEVAKRLGFGGAFDYKSAADVFREHAALSAFENVGGRDFDIGALQTVSDDGYDEMLPLHWPMRWGDLEPRERFFFDGGYYTNDRRPASSRRKFQRCGPRPIPAAHCDSTPGAFATSGTP